ncbi:MAG: hypothetical protein B7X41_03755 [Microbacterium sp. 14-71-5]|jgi:uncharacterized RDD family membrane protein YckC|nr:MAG: hypothetical protein B7X41_03755 [Microbacterium sp. 14-71-5]
MTTTAPVSGDMSRLSPALAGTVAAPAGRRVSAYVVDCLAAGGLFALANVGPVVGLYGASQLEVAGLVVAVVVGLVQWGMHASSGQTIGKRLFGLRTVTVTDGRAPGAGRTAGRLLLWDVIALVPIVGFPLVALSVFFDSTGLRRGWHDLVTGVVLIDVQRGRDPLAGASSAHAERVGQAPPHGVGTGPVPVAAPLVPAVPSSVPTSAAPGPVPAAVAPVAAPVAPTPVIPTPVIATPATPTAAIPAPAAAVAPPAPAAPTSPASAPVATQQRGGLIAAVPGMAPGAPAMDVVAVPPTPPAPSASAPTPAWGTGPGAGCDDVDQTVLSVAALRVAPSVRLRFDTGEELEVTGPGRIGRDPQPGEEPVTHRIPLDDRTRSVSKTHLEFRLTDGRLWVRDLHSTNGSRISTGGAERPLEAGRWVPADAGDVVHLGSRTFTVVAG